MSTETIKNAIEDALDGLGFSESTVSIPMSASVEVGGDIEEAVDEEVARAEAEGMVGVPLPVPGEHEEELRMLEEMGKHDHEAEKVSNLAWAMDRIIEVNQHVIEQKAVVKEAQAVVKDEKETLESLQDELNRLITDAAKAKQANEPDPEKFPLFDKAKAEINAAFPKPDAIQPLPPDDFAEALRRRQRDTPLASMGLKASTLKALEDLGLTSALQLVDLLQDALDKGRKPTSTKGLTENRYAEVVEALVEITDAAESEWAIDHPGEEGGDE